MSNRPLRRKLAAAICVAGAAVLAGTGTAVSASARTVSPAAPAARSASGSNLPVDFDFGTAFLSTVGSPTTSPPGANDFSCKPGAAHPFPVVLVHGTFANQNDDWQAASPELANHGYCVFALNYGGSSAKADLQGTAEIAASAQQLSEFVDKVLAATGAAKVDIVGHSQGGMMPRYYLEFLGGAARVHTLVGLAPSNHGTTLDRLATLANELDSLGIPVDGTLAHACEACVEQEQGSAFLSNLNASGDTVAGVNYTVIETKDDEVVTPFQSAFLSGPDVTGILVQNQCSQDASDHLEIASDPVAMADMLNALDPAHLVTVPCVPVEPVFGPVGPVPSF